MVTRIMSWLTVTFFFWSTWCLFCGPAEPNRCGSETEGGLMTRWISPGTPPHGHRRRTDFDVPRLVHPVQSLDHADRAARLVHCTLKVKSRRRGSGERETGDEGKVALRRLQLYQSNETTNVHCPTSPFVSPSHTAVVDFVRQVKSNRLRGKRVGAAVRARNEGKW